MMKGIIIVNKWLTEYLSFGKANAITLFPVILLKQKSLKNDATLLNHEHIHLRQCIELLVIPFYIWYLAEFLIRFVFSGDFNKSYREISFEKEAYSNQANLTYISSRKLFSYLQYL